MDIDQTRQRLLDLARERDVSLSALSRMIGKNPTYLQQFIRKGSPRKLEEGDRGKLARFFSVDESWLGKPEDIYHDRRAGAAGQRWARVPRLAIGASAGHGAFAGEEEPFDAIGFSPRWLRSMGLVAENLAAIVVEGDSMAPTLQHGDEILVDRSSRVARDGIHVVRLDGSLMVKRLDTTRPGILVLVSDNSAYRPLECRVQDVEIVGKVVWKGGRIL